MKNILLSFATLTILAACNSKADLNSDPEEITIRNIPLYNTSSSDTAKAEEGNEQSAKLIPKRKSIKHKINIEAPQTNIQPVYTSEPSTGPRVVTLPDASPVITAPASTQGNTGTSAGAGSNEGTTATTIPQPEKKKGWSKAAKGAVIGAGAGAIGGIILSKKKGLGAVVGGVVGAAGGYIIGKGMDKKDNRLIEN